MRSVILFIAMSLDGFIAKTDGDISFLSLVEKEGEDYGYSSFNERVDTVIIGRNTYDKVLSMGFDYPHNDKEVFIITRGKPEKAGNFKSYSGPLNALIGELKSKPGRDIYCDGGSILVNELLKDNLIDELIISVIPVLLGEGIALFQGGRPEMKLKLIDCKSFETGLVQLHYLRSAE
ncbi:MAG: dihydrofolate reductase family protein [Bacteroidales bacterium]